MTDDGAVHLVGFGAMSALHLVEAGGEALDSLGELATGQTFAAVVFDEHVVVGFGPIHSNEDRLLSLPPSGNEPEGFRSVLDGPVLEARQPTSRLSRSHRRAGARSTRMARSPGCCSAHLLEAR